MSDIPGWKYYNHAAIPTCAPHEMPNLTPLKDGSIWHIEGNKEFVELTVQKTKPAFEKYEVNASLVDGMLTAYSDKLGKGLYIYDGMKSINHETHFQDYLEKYFGFRKAYCELNVSYIFFLMDRIFFSPFRNFFQSLVNLTGNFICFFLF